MRRGPRLPRRGVPRGSARCGRRIPRGKLRELPPPMLLSLLLLLSLLPLLLLLLPPLLPPLLPLLLPPLLPLLLLLLLLLCSTVPREIAKSRMPARLRAVRG